MVKYLNDSLFFDGVDIEKFAKGRRTPFFLFSERILRDNYKNFKNYFTSHYKNTRIDYSVKTDYEKSVLKILNEEGSSAEIVASFELELLKNVGIPARKVVFDGPCKTDEEISFCLNEGIHAIYADSADELDRINGIARRMRVKAHVGLRIRLGLKTFLTDLTYRFVSKFGVGYDEALETLVRAKELANLKIIAISTHMGSQMLKPDKYLKACDMLTRLAKECREVGVNISEISLGGGFPSKTLIKVSPLNFILTNLGAIPKQNPVPLKEFGSRISRIFAENVKKYHLAKITLALQPGRAISSNIGIAVSRVWVVKKGWAFIDISTSSIPESFLFAKRRIIPVVRHTRSRAIRYSIAGKGLNSVDNFTFNEPFPEIKPGDLMVVLDAGAYSISRANRFTTLNPPIYMIEENGNIEVVRREETYKDVLGPMEF